ncbi:MAG: prepilin-type N-terminal cleavage/methylation domain-containing protein [Patiriisocius sp.]|jgi:prepilin-type N-terminal cleavage/methylation domain-containing protein
MYTKQLYTKKSSGFTLIEVLVSMSIFTIVVSMAVGSLVVLIDANAKAQNVQAIVSNVSFALDSMTREIRTGFFYECESSSGSLTQTDSGAEGNVRSCSSGGSAFAFTEGGNSLTDGMGSLRIAFRYNSSDDSIERRLGTSGVWQRITAPDVVITNMEFVVTGTATLSSGNTRTPTVSIFISGEAGSLAETDSTFNLQATVAQQTLDI